MKFKILAILALATAFALPASAATVVPADPISIDFGTGLGTGGTIISDGVGGYIGTNLAINAVNIANATNSSADGAHEAVALLSFDTASGRIYVDGTVDVDASTGLTSSQTLFAGNIDSWTYSAGTISIFSAEGGGSVSADLANFMGESTIQAYTFAEFSLSIGDNVRSTDLLLAGPDRGLTPPAVPVPAAMWLMGSGLLGLVGVARRKTHS